MGLNKEKCLIAYFSRKGDNYVNGRIMNLLVGNTEVAAKMIQEITQGDIFHIDTVNAYPKDYTLTTNIAQREKQEKVRPELISHIENIDSYSAIFLGYPNWWGTIPMPIYTFLEEYDFSGKTIMPFCTHEGSGLGNSEIDIVNACPKAKILKGLAIYGSQVDAAKKDIKEWLDKIDI